MNKINYIKKGLIFVLLTFCIALIIESFIAHPSELLIKLRKGMTVENSKIIFFGDSVIGSVSEKDTDKRSISELLENYSGKKVISIGHSAYHLGVYEAYSKYICKNNNFPTIVIVPINLRSFSLEWDTRPEYQFKEEINIIENSSSYKLLYDRIWTLLGHEDAKWKESVVYYNNLKRGVVNDYLFSEDPVSQEMIKSKYIFEYLYNLDPNHRKIINLENIIKNYQDCNIPFLIYITPIDFKTGEKYVGEDFLRIVKNNISVIKEVEKKYKIKLLDLSLDLDETYFDHPNTPNEHLKEKGRKYVAGHILDEINKNIISKKY